MQKTFDLADGGAVILSVAKYAAPSGKQFEDVAVTPGTVVAPKNDFLADEADDEDSAAATASTTKPTAKKAAPETDDQLNKALEMLKAKA
jgi:carboxyl-terminal processing protease